MVQVKDGKDSSLLKVIPLILTLLGICVGLFQYNQNYKRDIRKDSYASTFTVYQDFIEKCAVLSHYDKDSVNTEVFLKDYKEFERIYFGRLLIVQDSAVSNKATQFYIGLNKFRQKHSQTSTSDLEYLLYDLIKKSKESLKTIRNEDEPF